MAGIDGVSVGVGTSAGLKSTIKNVGAGRVKEFAINASVSGGLLQGPEGIYSSSWHDTKDSDRIMGTVFTSGSSGTFQIEQTPDTGTVDPVSGSDYVSTQVFVSDSIGAAFSVELVANYVRTKYINDSGSQVQFRLYTFFKG